MKQGLRHIISIAIMQLVLFNASALQFPVPKPEQHFVGHWQTVTVKRKDTLARLAYEHDVSVDAVMKYNPSIKRVDRIYPKQKILMPTCYQVPELEPDQIVVNLANQNLYYRPKSGEHILVYPVTIGSELSPTPLGNYHITRKRKDPIWFPPKSIREAKAKQGITLPDRVPAGKHNPLGEYAIYLSKPTYLIHTAINLGALGGKRSYGCVRMYKRDIEQLYPEVKPKLPVDIISSPVLSKKQRAVFCRLPHAIRVG